MARKLLHPLWIRSTLAFVNDCRYLSHPIFAQWFVLRSGALHYRSNAPCRKHSGFTVATSAFALGVNASGGC